MFSVPSLNNFCKICNSLEGNSSYTVHSGKASLPRHTHPIIAKDTNAQLTLKSSSVNTPNADEIKNILSGFLRAGPNSP